MTRTFLVSTLLLGACSGGLLGAEPPPEPDVPEKCKNIHRDRLAGDWISFAGKPDPKTRMRISEPSTVGGDYEAWFINGFFTKRVLMGEKRDEDVRFTEVPSGKRAERIAKGEEKKVRVYVKPRLSKCALEVFIGKVDDSEKEEIPPRGIEFLTFPDTPGVTFSYRPAERELFLGEAAGAKKVADAQVEELGHAKPDHELGTVPVGLFSHVESDGDAKCAYTMDLYFDDQLIEGGNDVAAGPVEDDHRHWFHQWEAPYSGNHHFEMHRYRTCGGGDRQLIDVAAIEAVLQ
jgi:hypothetical protein